MGVGGDVGVLFVVESVSFEREGIGSVLWGERAGCML